MIENKNILIIGGSSGIGLALAELLASTQEELDTSELPDHLHGFVYCPGSINLRPFKGLKLDAFQSDFEINVLGAVRSLKSVLGHLSASGDAAVVFYSTVAVQTGMPFHSSVASSKGAIEGLTRSLAAEFAPKIRVNAIAPSLVNTPLASKFLNNETKMEKANERHPLGRVGSAIEIAQATAFLLSKESSWMTGRILQLDGGIGNLKT